MKQNLIYENLYVFKKDLDGQIAGLSKYIRIIKNSNEERYR